MLNVCLRPSVDTLCVSHCHEIFRENFETDFRGWTQTASAEQVEVSKVFALVRDPDLNDARRGQSIAPDLIADKSIARNARPAGSAIRIEIAARTVIVALRAVWIGGDIRLHVGAVAPGVALDRVAVWI